MISITAILFFAIFNDKSYAQERDIDEFLEWPSTNNYNFVVIVIVIMIGIGIVTNYLWSNRKGRRFSEE